MLHLALQMARSRALALLAVACAVLGGAALVTSTGVLAESGLRSHATPDRLSGADVLVSAHAVHQVPEDLDVALPGRHRIPVHLLTELAEIPGVTAAVGDLSFPAALVGDDGHISPTADPQTAGHGWSSTELYAGATTGVAPAGQTEIAVGAAVAATTGVAPGDTVEVVTAGMPATYRVTGIVDAPGLYFADPTATELAARSSGSDTAVVDLIGLRTEPGSTEAAATSARDLLPGGLTVTTGDDRGAVEQPGAAAARPLLLVLSGSLSGIVLLVIGFAVAGAIGVSVAGQRRELALLRAVGATPRQIRRLVVRQALAVSAVATVPGVVVGYLLTGPMRELLVEGGLLPDALPLTVSPLPAAAAVLLLATAVTIAATAAVWRTSRLPATAAVTESHTEPKTPSVLRTTTGGLLIVAATTLALTPLWVRTELGAGAVPLSGLLGAIGFALAAPALLRLVGDALATRLPVRTPVTSWLAVANLRTATQRTAGIVASLTMIVVFALTYTLSTTTLLTAAARDVQDGTLAQYRVTATELGGVPTDLQSTVQDVPGVQAVVPTTATTVLWPYTELGDQAVESSTALVLDPDAAAVLDLGIHRGELADLTGATVAVGADVARTRHADLGQDIDLVLGDGSPVRARVVAVYDRTLGFGPVVVSADLAAGHTGTGLAQQLLVRTDGSTAARDALAALSTDRPGVELNTTAPPGSTLSDAPAQVWLNLATIIVLLGYLLLTITNKLVAGTVQRRGELAVLRLTGATPPQIRSMVRREAGVITAVALVGGLLLTAIPLTALGVGFLGRPWAAGPLWLLPALVAVVAAVAFLTTELPTRRAMRTNPVAALARAV